MSVHLHVQLIHKWSKKKKFKAIFSLNSDFPLNISSISLDNFSKVPITSSSLEYFLFVEQHGNKDLQLKYADNIRLIALSKQIKIGPWNASHAQDVGFLDVVGNDRK